MCPDVSLDHVVKEAIFTDCSEDRNLQPDNPFRTTYPDEKGFILRVYDDSFNGTWISLSFLI